MAPVVTLSDVFQRMLFNDNASVVYFFHLISDIISPFLLYSCSNNSLNLTKTSNYGKTTDVIVIRRAKVML